jgi:FkbM family methyltransferase
MDEAIDIPRDDFRASMALLQKQGFKPATFIDIGAAEAIFFLGRREVGLFPSARHFFVDAMQENEEIYRRIGEKFGTGYEIAAVSSANGSATMRIDPDFYDTHVDKVQEGSVHEQRRTVPMTTLDSLVARHALQPPFAIKLDVQGGEVDALRGAARTLDQAVMVTAETRLANQRDTFVELLAFMTGAGWSLFDVTDLTHSPTYQTLDECYATFLPARLDFRKGQPWASAEHMAIIHGLLRQRRQRNVEAVEELLRNL